MKPDTFADGIEAAAQVAEGWATGSISVNGLPVMNGEYIAVGLAAAIRALAKVDRVFASAPGGHRDFLTAPIDERGYVDFREQDRAARASAPGGESGWRWVPVEPTEEMKRAAFGPIMMGGRGGPITADYIRQEAALDTYRKIIAAAPSPAESGWREETLGPTRRWVNGDQRIYETTQGDFVRADAGGWLEGSYPTFDAARAAFPPVSAPPAESAGEVERTRCPIGIAPESRSICSAGTCYDCLADRCVWSSGLRNRVEAAEAKCRELEGEVARLCRGDDDERAEVRAAYYDRLLRERKVAEANLTRLTLAAQAARGALERVVWTIGKSRNRASAALVAHDDAREALASLDAVLPGSGGAE
jgi:hypothetical protein